MTDIQNMPIEEVVKSLPWKFAKTMSRIPHWYTVRNRNNPEQDALYRRLFDYIQENPVWEKFYSRMYKYGHIGEYKYWCADTLEESKVINRTLIDTERLRREFNGIGL